MNNIFKILKKEMRDIFRDKKSLSMMLIVPFIIPFIILLLSFIFDMETNKDINSYNKIGFTYELNEIEKNLATSMSIEYKVDSMENLQNSLDNNEIYLIVTKEDNYKIIANQSDSSTYALSLMKSYFESYKSYLQNEYLLSMEIDPNEVLNILNYEVEVVDEDNFFANYMTNYAFLFIIMAITISATYPSTDTTAGEKERGTLETLLTFPVKSKDIILGKFLSVSLSSSLTGIISLILMIISLKICDNTFEIYKDINLVPSVTTVIYSLVVIVAYSLLISGLSISIASKCKSFKEAQSALTPLTFISVFPSMIAFLSSVETSFVTSLIPFLNFTLIFNDIVSGNLNILYLLLTFISTIVFISLIMYIIIKQYNKEKVLF